MTTLQEQFEKDFPDKEVKEIKSGYKYTSIRLESKLQLLKTIQDNISNHSLLDKLQQKKLVKKENKATQTELVIELKK